MEMAQVLAGWARSVLACIVARPYSLLGLVFLLGLAIPSFLRSPQDWESVYVPAAVRLQQGEDIFQNHFVYPPINAWLPIPFVGLPRVPSRALWYAINMTALTVLILGAWKLSGGNSLEGTPPRPCREHAIFWLGLGCGISSCLDTITNQQTDLIVAALVVVGCIALVQGRDLRAALWFGAAAAIKCTPLLWAPYLAWRRRWAAALLVVAVAVGVNMAPDLAYPPETGMTRLEEWTRRHLLPMAEANHDLGTWSCGVGGNQSIAGIWQRWLVYDTKYFGVLWLPHPRDARNAQSRLVGQHVVAPGRGPGMLLANDWEPKRQRGTGAAIRHGADPDGALVAAFEQAALLHAALAGVLRGSRGDELAEPPFDGGARRGGGVGARFESGFSRRMALQLDQVARVSGVVRGAFVWGVVPDFVAGRAGAASGNHNADL
jgi:hypothetical protein